MAVPTKFIAHQGPILAALGRTAFAALKQQAVGSKPGPLVLPGPEVRRTVPPRSPALVKAYTRNVGGDPRVWARELPPHLFPQWGFGLASLTLESIPYPLVKVMNGGCRLEVRGPLAIDASLDVCAQLKGIDDNGRRAVLHQHIVTGTKEVPEAVLADLYAIVPLGGPKGEKKAKRRERPRVPNEVRELAYWKLGPGAGLDFAKLTGDFNPVHWLVPYAKAMGFKNTILHGFGTMARAWEGLRRYALAASASPRVLDVRFTRPLVLPARVGLYVDDADGVFVGDAPGGPAYMTGTWSV